MTVVAAEVVPVVVAAVVAELALVEAASTWETTVAAVVGEVPAVGEEAGVIQVPVALVEEVELHSHPVAAVEFLRVTADEVALAAAAGVAVGVVDLHRKGSGFRHDPFV